MTQTWTSPSGSRWEPVPSADPGPLDDAAGASAPEPQETDRRHRRSPVLVLLVALLSLGAVTGQQAGTDGPARHPWGTSS